MTYRCNDDPVPDWKLERYRLGELPADERAAIGKALESDADLRARLSALETSDAAILNAYPVARMARLIRDRAAQGEKGNPVRVWFGPALAVAAVLVLAVVALNWPPDYALTVRDFQNRGSDGVEHTRVKGGAAHLLLFRKTATGVEHLTDGDSAHAGDLLQIFYQTPRPVYGAIFSTDGRGAVTVHLPESGTAAVRLLASEPVPLGFSYQLDDAPKWERFYFVTSDAPFTTDRFVGALQADGRADSLHLDRAFDLFTFTLYKEKTP